MPAFSKNRLVHYLPHALVATFFVALAPLVVVYALERYGLLTSAFAATGVGVLLSIALARAGAWLWMRHSGSADLVFGDLMLWGWVRRVRHEKRMKGALALLGYDDHGMQVKEVDLPAARSTDVLRELASSLEHGDPFTHGHTRRVTRYAEALAKTMRLPKATQNKIRTAAAVHDVGKVDVPSEILNKPGRLTDEEFAVMKRHSARGSEMVAPVGDPEITAMVRHHHERIDGRGYPDRLSGEDIPLGARVIAVADTFDAIISTRPYRAPRAHREAIEILKRAAGTQLDDDVVQAFLTYYSGRKPLAWWLSLSAGMQRVLGGFGGWLQHAGAASVTRGATSLGATIALTTAMATVAPGLGVGRHAGPALPEGRDQAVVAEVDDGSGASADPIDSVDEDAHTRAPEPAAETASQGGAGGAEPKDAGSPPQDAPAMEPASHEETAPPDEAIVAEPAVVDEEFDASGEEVDDSGEEGAKGSRGEDKGRDKDKCSKGDQEVIVTAASDAGPTDEVGEGNGNGKGGSGKGRGRGSCDDKGKGKNDDKDNDNDNGNGKGQDKDKGKDGKTDGDGKGKGKDKDKDKDQDADEEAEVVEEVAGDDDSSEGSDGTGEDVEPPAEEAPVETEEVTVTETPEVEVSVEDSGETPSPPAPPPADGTLPAEESDEE